MGGWCAQIAILHVETVLKKPSGISEPELLINQFCRCSGAFYYLCDIYLYNYFLHDVYTELVYIQKMKRFEI